MASSFAGAPLIIMAAALVVAVGLFRVGGIRSAAAGLMIVLGAIGFFGAPNLKGLGDRLSHTELPAVFETTTVEGRDGCLFAFTRHVQRVQRYCGGRFELGWFVDSAGGHGGIGISREGDIVISAVRHKAAYVFDVDGHPIGSARPFNSGSGSPDHLLPGAAKIEATELARSRLVANPRPSVTTWLLFPFLSPHVAWLLLVVAFMIGGPYPRRAMRS